MLGTWSTDRLRVGQWSTWPWVCLALAVRTLLCTSWTMCGQISLRHRHTWCSPSMMLWRDSESPWDLDECCCTHCRWEGGGAHWNMQLGGGEAAASYIQNEATPTGRGEGGERRDWYALYVWVLQYLACEKGFDTFILGKVGHLMFTFMSSLQYWELDRDRDLLFLFDIL